MSSHFYVGTLAGTLPKWRFRRQAAANKDWKMLKLVGWLATAATLAFLIWQTAATDPLWPRTVSGLLLVVISILAGLRIGTDSAAAYTKDLQRLNKVLAEQNRNLEDANAILLRKAKVTASSKSA